VSSIPLASETATLVRRRLYRVPVVVLKPVYEHQHGGYFGLTIIPVLGPAHADPELRAVKAHYHIDWRFMPSEIRRELRNEQAGREKGIVVWACDVLRTEEQAWPYRLPAEAWPSWDKVVRPTLEGIYAKAHLKPGLICPHKGADLTHCPADENGVVECPLHGLRWNIHTGELVPAATPCRS
jgi:hypothetical protein